MFPGRIEFYRDDILRVVVEPAKILVDEKIQDIFFAISGGVSFCSGLKNNFLM